MPVVTVAEPEQAARLTGLPLEATIAMADVAGAIKDGLLAFASATGLVVMFKMMEAELTEMIGPKHARIPGREGNWHGTTTGSVVLGGQKLTAERPRGRSTDKAEIALGTWTVFSSEDLLTQVVVERMLAGVSTRRHQDVAEPLGAELDARSKATSRSAVSRRFRRATEKALAELLSRDLSDLDVAVVMIDGIEVAGSCLVAALVITTDGRKIPVGLYLGDTENKTVVTDLLADLCARGLLVGGGLLVVIDGAKALAAGVRKVFGDHALVQRCTLHKRRNVAGYLPKEAACRIDRRLALAFNHPDPDKGLARARAIATELERDHPDAAASLREGLDDMFTVRRLGVSGRLAKSLTNTNCIESMISVARTVMGNVKRWKDGPMKKRWVATGMLEAERSFRRVKGCQEMPVLVDALRRHARSVKGSAYDDQAA
ncbi:MAG TPA: IS256 family transposase [Actinomycetota bacterium]